jgi:hypothetical protein
MRRTSLALRAFVRAGVFCSLAAPGCSADPAAPIEIEALAQGGLCGDGLCLGDETDASCPGDCGCSSQPSLCAVQVLAPYGCWCDAECHASGDCCADVDICGEVPPTGDEHVGNEACAWGDWEPGFFDEVDILFYQAKYRAVAEVGERIGEEAAMYLRHFLDNSGTEMDVDVDTMLDDVSAFAEQVRADREAIAKKAAADAERADAGGEVRKEIPVDWKNAAAGWRDDINWFLALHGFQYNQTGTVTVKPAGDRWSFEVESRIHVADYYDWDPDGSVPILDTGELYALNCFGAAQNYWIRGVSDESTLEGTTP